MSTTPSKLSILNSALRKVGSFHLDASDTTSTTYEIVNQAYNDAVLEVFAENTFILNTKKLSITPINTTAYTDQQYGYSYDFPDDLNILLYITNKESTAQVCELSLIHI